MFKYTSTLLLSVLCTIAFAQNPYIKKEAYKEASKTTVTPTEKEDKLLYGPLPYRTLQETVGETYLVLPLMQYALKEGYENLFKKGNSQNLSSKDAKGKRLKLTAVNNDEGVFVDSVGIEYICKISKGRFRRLTPVADIENCKKLFINKTLWLNINEYMVGDPYGETSEEDRRKDQRFLKITVIDVLASYSNDAPVYIIFKNEKGEIGSDNVNVSGTNTNLDPKYWFNEKFYTENPQVKYKLTPKVWAAVKAGRVEIGMPEDAVELIEGRPRKRNTTTTGTTITEQWVYGETAMRFFYFTNGKLTSWSN